MNKIDFNKCHTLVAAGCSHTQGCAFTKYHARPRDTWNDPNFIFPWANERIANKFNTDCTAEFITNNLTWMAYLRDYINIGKIFNLGYGGLGTTSTIRSLQNYYFNTPDLTDTLVVVQLQYNYRDEIMIKYESGRVGFETLQHFYSNNYPEDSGLSRMRKDYLFHLYDENFLMLEYLFQLLYLQKSYERSGAEFRIFAKPWFSLPKLTIREAKEYENIYGNYSRVGWEKAIQGPLSIAKLYKELNIIDTQGMSTIVLESTDHKKLLDKHVPTLHRDYGLEGDYHFSDLGNKYFAKHLATKLNSKRDIRKAIELKRVL